MSYVDEDDEAPARVQDLRPKDLVMFSPAAREAITKSDYNYLIGENKQVAELPDYDNDPKYRVWGLPYYSPLSPLPLGFWGGITAGIAINIARKRPRFSSLHIHALSGILIGLSAKFAYKILETRRYNNDLVIWDYVRHHKQDFPEVFNEPKKYKDLLRQWNPKR